MDGRDFILNIDYGIDKVIASFSGSFNASAAYGPYQARRTTHTFEHNVGNWCLPIGAYSRDGGTSWQPMGVTLADTTGGIPTFQTVEISCYCSNTEIGIVASNFLTSSQNIQYVVQLVTRS